MTLRDLWKVTCRNEIWVQVDKTNGWMKVLDGRSESDPAQLVPLVLGTEKYSDRKVIDISCEDMPMRSPVLKVVVTGDGEGA